MTEVCVEAPETSSGIMLIEFIRIIPEFISASSTLAVSQLPQQTACVEDADFHQHDSLYEIK